MSSQLSGGEWFREVQQLRAQLATSEARVDEESENYIQMRDKWDKANAQVASLREALEKQTGTYSDPMQDRARATAAREALRTPSPVADAMLKLAEACKEWVADDGFECGYLIYDALAQLQAAKEVR